MRTFAIEGVIRRYDWGSHTAIQQLLGVEPDGRPAAELWFGAHPGAPSPALGRSLDQLIADEPQRLLGAEVLRRFGPHLPYLLKVLAAERSLSMQVHPTLAQARAGFAAENPSYTDANHKPELLCALSRFEALCGFRPVAETLDLIAPIPQLRFVADKLRSPDGLRSAFTAILTSEQPARLADAVASHAASDGPLRGVHLAATDFPGDVGVAVAVLLNFVILQPGEAIYLPAGNVHAYLRGTGVEIMANSDNVLRCGLTSKRIDVPELLKITDFTESPQPRWPEAGGTFRVPVPDFVLRRLAVADAARLDEPGPRIALCTAGAVSVDEVALSSGHAAFVPAERGPVGVAGDGQLFVASPRVPAQTNLT